MANTKYTYEDLVQIAKKSNNTKVYIFFSEPVRVRINKRNVKYKSDMEVKLFVSDENILAYTYHKRTGFAFEYNWIDKIKEVVVPDKETEDKINEKINKDKKINQLINLMKKTKDYVWPEVQNEVLSGEYKIIVNHYTKNIKTANIKKIFSKTDYNRIKDAIENKKNMSVRTSTSKRDHSIEIKVLDDGTVRGWYSSEYSGMLNGDYYLLLTPEKALYVETD